MNVPRVWRCATRPGEFLSVPGVVLFTSGSPPASLPCRPRPRERRRSKMGSVGDRRVVVVTDGGLPALVALTCAAERAGRRRGDGPVAFVPPLDDLHPMRLESVRSQCEVLGLDPPIAGHEWLRLAGTELGPTAVLLAACQLAGASSASAVIWPITAGGQPELTRMAALIEQAMLVSRLACAGSIVQSPVDVRVPYVDLTDAQVAELALDVDAPLWECWWWRGAGDAGAAQRRYWMEHLKRAGWSGTVPASAAARSMP